MSLEDNKNEKTKKNNIIFYTITGLIFLFNILGWISFKKNYNKKNNELLEIKSLEQSENSKNKVENINQDFEIKNGYKYKKSNGESSTFALRNLGYAESLMNNQVSYDNVKEEYCTIVNEIVKVDNGIMPGTTKPFEEVTYIQVDDAYREHLQKIAQIRQVFDTIYGNDNDLENGAGCHYTGTHWNNANSQYRAKQFYDSSIIEYLNNHSYGVQNSVNSYSKKENENNDIEKIINNTVNEIDQIQNNNSENSDENYDE